MQPDTGYGIVQGLSGALLVGLSGFLYLHGSYFQRFKHASASQPIKTSLAFAFGIGWLLLTAILLAILRIHAPHFVAAVTGIWLLVTPIEGLSPAFLLAPLVGLSVGVLGNFSRLLRASDDPQLADYAHPLFTTRLRTRMRLAALEKALPEVDDLFLATLWRAATLGRLVQVTLKGRQVYIGAPLALLDPTVETRWLQLVPIAIGYRETETLSFVPTADYRSLFGALSKDVFPRALQDLGILVCWTEIVSMTIHDPADSDLFEGQHRLPS